MLSVSDVPNNSLALEQSFHVLYVGFNGMSRLLMQSHKFKIPAVKAPTGMFFFCVTLNKINTLNEINKLPFLPINLPLDKMHRNVIAAIFFVLTFFFFFIQGQYGNYQQ